MHQTVILAAGNGSRFNNGNGAGGHGIPKPLVTVDGRPLIEHALAQAVDVGCEHAVVVLGKHGDQIREHLREVESPLELTLVDNPTPDLPNGVSLLAAEPYVEDRFFLQMVDHVFSRPVLNRLQHHADAAEPMRLLVDFDPHYLDESDATKVQVQDERIVAIGKKVQTWDAIDAGYFLLDARVFAALRSAERTDGLSVSAGMRQLAAAEMLAPVPIEEVAWVDVDTPRDRDFAERLLESRLATGV